MTDAASDKAKRKHSAMSYVAWLLIVYVVSYPFIYAYAFRQLRGGGFAVNPMLTVVEAIYWPLDKLVDMAGLTEPFQDLLLWMAERFP